MIKCNVLNNLVRNTVPLIFLLGIVLSVSAEEYNKDPNFAQVQSIRMNHNANGQWTAHVTVLHNDEGWEHYADTWQIINPLTEDILAERILAHPHINEQPFTRSLNNFELPQGTKVVLFRAKCNKHGFGGREILVDLGKESNRIIKTD